MSYLSPSLSLSLSLSIYIYIDIPKGPKKNMHSDNIMIFVKHIKWYT